MSTIGREMGNLRQIGPRVNAQPQQIHVDIKNATPKLCECGCKYFIPVVALHTVPAVVSPTGQELTAQQPILICMECKQPV